MQVQELTFQGSGDLELFAHVWKPETVVRALVVITHGHGEHSGRYVHVAENLASRGLAVAGPDLRGHGRSMISGGLAISYRPTSLPVC
jgi:alpha-beta hydrolase superfamily lysophospholipase